MSMSYTYLGRSGVQVSRLCLGTMMFGNWGIGEKESIPLIHRAIEQGINFIDTADIYGDGSTEEILGKALKGRREDIILATKFKIKSREGPNAEGASRHVILRQLDASLKRLQTDYIDLYTIHRPDPHTPIEETLRTLDDLIRAGKIRYIGCSNFDAWRIVEGLWASEKNLFSKFVCNQPRYNILRREIEQEILPASRHFGLSTLCYSPLEEGWLTGKYLQDIPEGTRGQKNNWSLEAAEHQKRIEQVTKLKTIADQLNVSLTKLSISWLLHRGLDIIPIIGSKKLEQLEENIQALELNLTTDIMDEINRIVPSPFVDYSLA